MDGRDGVGVPGSAPYYLSRVGQAGGSGQGSTVHGSGVGEGIQTPVFKGHLNPKMTVQQSVEVNSGNGVSSSIFHVENPTPSYSHGMSMTMVPVLSQGGGEKVKKKRGRPRKYRPDGAGMSLGLSPVSAIKPPSGMINSVGEKGRRGRPPGTGWKQKLAPLGEWMNSSAGLALTPHVIHIGVGEDVAAKVLVFAQQRPRALCILSGNGTVSAVTLRQPTTCGGTVTYEDHFEILCLSGSYLIADDGGPRNRTGGISISVCSPDGQIIGGAIGGRLIAAKPVQVVACSFVYGSTKAKIKPESITNDGKYQVDQSVEKLSTPVTAIPIQTIHSSGTIDLQSGSRQDIKISDIDLMHG